MKFAFGLFVFLWLLCGGIGAWILEDLDLLHWQLIAKGPITLVHAMNERPMRFPWQV